MVEVDENQRPTFSQLKSQMPPYAQIKEFLQKYPDGVAPDQEQVIIEQPDPVYDEDQLNFNNIDNNPYYNHQPQGVQVNSAPPQELPVQ